MIEFGVLLVVKLAVALVVGELAATGLAWIVEFRARFSVNLFFIWA